MRTQKTSVLLFAIVLLSLMAILGSTQALALPDLVVDSITPNCGGYLFANESNEICAKIKNSGVDAAGAFHVSFVAGAFSEQVQVTGGLAAGANTTVCVTDPTLRNAGDSVAITVTADCNGAINESNETNNASSVAKTVVNNGYKGKRYTSGNDITTWKTLELQGDLLYSTGDSIYLSGSSTPWTTYTANWTASDLLVPGTATVKEARLYVIYNWDKVQGMPNNVSMSFNSVPQTRDAFYTDRKGYATSDYPYGMLTYNVTAAFSTAGNTAILTNLNPTAGNPSLRGMLLVVIYEDANEPRRQIFINEEFDLLYGGTSACTTPEEATAWAPITGPAIDLPWLANATLITVAPGAGPAEGDLIFNEQNWTDVWNYADDSQIGIDERDVKPYLEETGNLAGFQSSADYMEASNAFLIVEELPAPAAEVYFVPEDIRIPKYCDTTDVSIWINTEDVITSGLMEFEYTYCCMNVTGYTINTTNWVPPSAMSLTPGKVRIILNAAGLGVGPGLLHVGNITVHCCNDTGYCFTDLTWNKTTGA
ncbi:MAG: DUF3344 domain-containing protein, partial [Halobacteriota archaeon]